MKQTYRIPERNLEGLQNQIEKLNRRARRLGVQEIMMLQTGEEFELWVLRDTLFDMIDDGYKRPWEKVELQAGESVRHGEERWRLEHPRLSRTFQVRRFVNIEVSGETPKIAGWSFAAVLQHLEGGNILAFVPGWEKSVPASYREAQPYCDHCRTARDRKDTYVVCSDAGEWKQVGRQCLRDFLGHQDPHKLAEWAELLASLSASCSAAEDFDCGGFSRESRWISMPTFLEIVAWAIRTEGWVSRKQVKESFGGGLQATADLAMKVMRPASGNDYERELRDKYDADEKHAEDDRVAHEAVEWAQNLEVSVENDYLWNLRVLARSEVIEIRQTGLAAPSPTMCCTRHTKENTPMLLWCQLLLAGIDI